MKTAMELAVAAALGAASAIGSLRGATLYVDLNSPNPTPPYTNWQTAAHVIQDAVDLAEPGAAVLVTNGVYGGGGTRDGRVALTKAVLLQSVNGPGVTVIDGGKTTRCAYLFTNAVISGFTLTNGAADGGVWCAASGVVTNCVIAGNLGRGAVGGTLYNCTLTGNWGGGALVSTLHNCIVTDNVGEGPGGTAEFGGGASNCTLYNCTLAGNSAIWGGGGAYSSTLYNCTVTFNGAQVGGGAGSSTLYNCIVYFNQSRYFGPNCHECGLSYCCIDADPLFVNAATGDFRLQTGSPCIDTGANLLAVAGYAGNPTDVLGNGRGVDGNGDGHGGWDIGAYEFGSFKPPRFAPPLLLTTNGFAFSLSGDPGRSVEIERSLDLQTWAPWLTATTSSNAVPVVDSEAGTGPRQFYRAVTRQ